MRQDNDIVACLRYPSAEGDVFAPNVPEIRDGVKWKMWWCMTPVKSILPSATRLSYSRRKR